MAGFYRARPLQPYETSSWHLPHELRDYQREALDAWLERGRGTIILPTAAGKTLTAIAALLKTKTTALVLVPTRVLVDQWQGDLAQAGIQAGVWFSERKAPSNVTVSTYQSAYLDPSILNTAETLILDEGDLTTGPEWGSLLRASQSHPYVMLLTATAPSDPVRLQLLQRYLPIVYEKSPQEMREVGAIAPLELIPYAVDLEPDRHEAYARLTVAMRRLFSRLRTHDFAEIARMADSADEETRKAARTLFSLRDQREEVVAGSAAKNEALLDIVRRHPGQKVIVFAPRVAAIESACGYLVTNGIACRVITGETLPEARHNILRDWGKTFQVLGNVTVLSRGLNPPEAGIEVILGGGRGERALIQRTGRVVRLHPEKTHATVYIVYANGTDEEGLFPTAERVLLGTGTKFFTGERIDQGLFGYRPDTYRNRRISFGK